MTNEIALEILSFFFFYLFIYVIYFIDISKKSKNTSKLTIRIIATIQ